MPARRRIATAFLARPRSSQALLGREPLAAARRARMRRRGLRRPRRPRGRRRRRWSTDRRCAQRCASATLRRTRQHRIAVFVGRHRNQRRSASRSPLRTSGVTTCRRIRAPSSRPARCAFSAVARSAVRTVPTMRSNRRHNGDEMFRRIAEAETDQRMVSLARGAPIRPCTSGSDSAARCFARGVRAAPIETAERPHRHGANQRRSIAEQSLGFAGEADVFGVADRDQHVAQKTIAADALDRAFREQRAEAGVVEPRQFDEWRREQASRAASFASRPAWANLFQGQTARQSSQP